MIHIVALAYLSPHAFRHVAAKVPNRLAGHVSVQIMVANVDVCGNVQSRSSPGRTP